MNKREFIYIAIILMLIACLYNGCKQAERANDLNTLYEASQDSLHKERNKQGLEKTATTLLYSTIADFKKMKTADSSTIGKLQRMVDRLTISATYLSTATGNTVTGVTSVTAHDTIVKNGIQTIYPEYRDTLNNRWEHFIMTANKDSFKLQYTVYNEFELVQEWKRNGIFKRKTPEVTILNLNPHTETKELKTFTVKENKGNRFRDMLIGGVIGALTVQAIRVFNVQLPIRF